MKTARRICCAEPSNEAGEETLSKLGQRETEPVSPTQSLRGTKFRGNLLHDAICLIIITSISQEIATSAAPPRNDYLKGEVVRVALRFTRVCFGVASQ